MRKCASVFCATLFVTLGSAIANESEAVATVPLLEKVAAPYVNLRTDIAKIEADGIASATHMRNAHHNLSSHDAAKLTKGYVAYAALVAADVEEFHKALDSRTRKSRDREKFLKELQTNPAMVRNIKGADKAIAAIMQMTADDATRIAQLGEFYIDQAYQIQKSAWAKKKLGTKGMTRVNGAAKFAQARPWPEMAPRPAIRSKAGNIRPNLTAEKDWAVDWSSAKSPPRPDSRAGMLMSQALVLATHYTVGTLEESHLREYAHSQPTNRCLINARLNFDQCIAATRAPYEEAFCIGTHGLKDVSRCVGWPASAGAAN